MSYKAKIVTAIQDLKDRTGSSAIAIKKHIMHANPEMNWMNSVFLTTLKKSVADKDFIQIKGSYKLSPEYKKKLADALKPKKPKKKAAPKKAAPKKKVATKKKAAPKKKASTKTKKKTTKKTPTKKASTKKASSKSKTTKKKTPTKKKSAPKKKVASKK
eukprot:CAMPEP_0113318506 /NCGR_PEP_ID=MMETSP0010_2-20120614/13047_1 /TAXON_ID=216773 ORGANISM="Corethron hystrix, Strain 308" /NCGR_SAMPLE_ID=MMETSP0010_2 /ASSEMBLY_ACC=CAM_ASM_000155 /LENGTH=158 /DNA_ID=CAMNT_0000175821 /DNA_START=81 /DNA_END=557 /DNA_ORIENTATION=+ /assembly_acc=CAM_ASM_000155